MVRLLLRRKGLRNQDPTVPALDRDSPRGERVDVAGFVNRSLPRFSQVLGVARPVLPRISVETWARCTRAEGPEQGLFLQSFRGVSRILARVKRPSRGEAA